MLVVAHTTYGNILYIALGTMVHKLSIALFSPRHTLQVPHVVSMHSLMYFDLSSHGEAIWDKPAQILACQWTSQSSVSS